MIICLCEGVSSREIEAVVQNGADSLEEVMARCQAGSGCGACHEQILEIVKTLKMVEVKKPCDIAQSRSIKKCLNLLEKS